MVFHLRNDKVTATAALSRRSRILLLSHGCPHSVGTDFLVENHSRVIESGDRQSNAKPNGIQSGGFVGFERNLVKRATVVVVNQ